MPVGGAGAQKSFVTKFLESLGDQLRNNEVQVFLNAGDHQHMKDSFKASLKRMKFTEQDYEVPLLHSVIISHVHSVHSVILPHQPLVPTRIAPLEPWPHSHFAVVYFEPSDRTNVCRSSPPWTA